MDIPRQKNGEVPERNDLTDEIELIESALKDMSASESAEDIIALENILEIYYNRFGSMTPREISKDVAEKLRVMVETAEVHLKKNIREFFQKYMDINKIEGQDEKKKAFRFVEVLRNDVIPRLKRHGMVENAYEIEDIISKVGGRIDS